MADGNAEPVERIHRTPVQYLLLVLARPSIWLIWFGGVAVGLAVFSLLLPRWMWTLGSPVYAAAVLVPLCAWRMRVLDSRAVAEGRLAVPEPRRLPAEALEPAALRATVDDALRGLFRYDRVGRYLVLALAVLVFASIFLPTDDIPRWVWIPFVVGGGGWMCWMVLRVIPRFQAAARETRDGFVAGTVPQRVGRIVRINVGDPVVEIPDEETRYEVTCGWSSPPGVRADDEVLVVGEWRRGAVVLVTGVDHKGRPKSFWGELKP
ncbi:hypothetical protein [Cryptosporangium phraense]|uniref:Uncharacterized protein n=1 Tax=Cryptosporangium phraense TaxID=2593070 RepID=A0A545AG10_9ACTN|nr:hypothetical protein [Cryptosporangium phraense]TQS40266.1 hypothetical protein FL583_35705 [Cryptosporangium phraense]